MPYVILQTEMFILATPVLLGSLLTCINLLLLIYYVLINYWLY